MKKKDKVINPIDMLFDENNMENIVLYNDKDEPVEFEQVELVSLDNKFYAILQPVNEIDGVFDDEAFAFEIVRDKEKGDSLVLVEDDALIDKIFDEYKKMYKANIS